MSQMEKLYQELSQRMPQMELLSNEPMSLHTSFRVGGPVPLMALPKNQIQALCAVRTAYNLNIQPFFLGNGTNLLVGDEGAQIFVVRLLGDASQIKISDDGKCLSASCGLSLAQLSKFAQECGLSGLEFAQGIPGTLGGGIVMNAGAYGGELSQVVKSVTAMERDSTIKILPASDLDFDYRHSAFSDGTRLLLSAVLKLNPDDPQQIKARMDGFAQRRREKQPLELPSAGSTFKRPQGHFAAALIDQCGLKGLRCGGAQVSPKHAGFIVNTGGASCQDILSLMEQVQKTVFEKTGVQLEPEVKIIGR